MTKSNFKKAFFAFIVVIILLLIYGVFGSNNSAVKTEVVYKNESLKTINTQVFVVRDEKIIENEVSGTAIPLIEDGAKVAKGDVFSVIFNSAEDASAYMEAEAIKENLDRYKQFNSKQNLSAIDIEKLDKKIDLVFVNMLGSVNKQNFNNYALYADDLRDELTNRQIAVGVQEVDLSEKISYLNQKLEQIETNGQSTKKLFSEYAGYYVSLTDGSEKTISYDNIENVSAVEIEQAISGVNNDFISGTSSKIICSFNWYLLACVDDSEAVDIRTGDEKEILIGKNGELSLNVTVYSINHLSADKAAIVFVCQQMNEIYAAMRVEDAQIVLNRYDGYKINNTAIRTKDGIKGVYVLRNNVVVFRKINLIESHENYCIAEIVLNNSVEKGYNNIELYDEIVVEGKNLYEGKVIRR